MTWKRNVLVVANVTATSDELLSALGARAEQGPSTFTLLIPATASGGGKEQAAATLEAALGRMREAGLEVDGQVGSGDPLEAVTDIWDPKSHDEIIVSTLPLSSSKWLHAGLPERIGKATGAPVAHVVSAPPKPAAVTGPAPQHEAKGVMMGPLSVMGWGGHK
jgi:hypothetical protein